MLKLILIMQEKYDILTIRNLLIFKGLTDQVNVVEMTKDDGTKKIKYTIQSYTLQKKEMFLDELKHFKL